MSTPNPLEYITFRGVTVDRKTAAALQVVENRLGRKLVVIQGHNPGGVTASAGTHDKGGVVDLGVADWANTLKVCKQVGFAIWHRTPDEGPWVEHLHGCLIGHQNMTDLAVRQVQSYLAGRNGLSDNALDKNPWRPSPMPENFSYAKWWNDQLLLDQIGNLRTQIALAKSKLVYYS